MCRTVNHPLERVSIANSNAPYLLEMDHIHPAQIRQCSADRLHSHGQIVGDVVTGHRQSHGVI